MRRKATITALATGVLLALGATAYATTGADPDSPLGIVGSAVCSFIHSMLH
jgi:hypothetical protein